MKKIILTQVQVDQLAAFISEQVNMIKEDPGVEGILLESFDSDGKNIVIYVIHTHFGYMNQEIGNGFSTVEISQKLGVNVYFDAWWASEFSLDWTLDPFVNTETKSHQIIACQNLLSSKILYDPYNKYVPLQEKLKTTPNIVEYGNLLEIEPPLRLTLESE